MRRGLRAQFSGSRQLGTFTKLHDFCLGTHYPHCPDGSEIYGGLVEGTNGNLYGTAQSGGAASSGTIFGITKGGRLAILYSFCALTNCADGRGPYASPVQHTNGNFYGTTTNPEGTIFSMSLSLRPFVSVMRSSGIVGQTEGILGQGFTGATSVSFNGAPAPFTIQSDTYLTATVPAGATTGFVTVTTPSGTLKSNRKFRVTPQILSFSPASGPVGTSVAITGNSFMGANAVVLGSGLSMSFTVDSDTQITATVPSGAKTGSIGVRTPAGQIRSATNFTVTP